MSERENKLEHAIEILWAALSAYGPGYMHGAPKGRYEKMVSRLLEVRRDRPFTPTIMTVDELLSKEWAWPDEK